MKNSLNRVVAIVEINVNGRNAPVLQKYALALFGFQRRRAVVNTTSIFKHTALRTQISRYEKIKILEGVVIILNALNKRRGRNIGCRIKGRQRQWAVRNSQPVITTKDKQLVMLLGNACAPGVPTHRD